ncbi:alpha/beta fold hydrolase [Rhizobium binxianense]|uniref:alpha/beta fold hydrolase n=1 Tax=Rhizobium binxianense TaxID=3024242 RepID=UPI0023A97730|nr:alpha/beta hydrolase [Rhizobium sp. MJ22]WEA26909.1 alpha/beta hydrolase [Rhizobium sp. MJ22]
MSSWTGTDFSREVVGNKTPVLAVLGGKDPGTSIEGTNETVGTWYGSVAAKVLVDAGHYPMYEAADQFVELVSEHLARF